MNSWLTWPYMLDTFWHEIMSKGEIGFIYFLFCTYAIHVNGYVLDEL